MTVRGDASSVNSAAITERLATNPPEVPDSSFWFSDREIGERHSRVALAFSTDDFRAELRRVQRRMYGIAIASIAVGAIALVAILATVLHIGLRMS